jgi:hypothetical protein
MADEVLIRYVVTMFRPSGEQLVAIPRDRWDAMSADERNAFLRETEADLRDAVVQVRAEVLD